MQAANATLSAHSGAVKISRGDLIHIPTPPRTVTWRPVGHDTLVALIERHLTTRGFGIKTAEFAVQNGKVDGRAITGAKLFATFVLENAREDFAFALGLRASNDKSMAIEMVAGCRVFVCDNMALSGDAEIMWKKHTSGLHIESVIPGGVDRAIRRLGTFETGVSRLKEAVISDIEAKATIYDSVMKGVLPKTMLPAVGKAYFEPPHQDFEPRTKWSLHNAYTEVYRTEYATSPAKLLESSQSLGAMFGI
jgi:hypothetical protein